MWLFTTIGFLSVVRDGRPHLAPLEPATDGDSFGIVAMMGRMQEAIRALKCDANYYARLSQDGS